MTSEESNRIVSEDYADLLLEYLGDETILQSFPDATINPINFLLSVVHVPVEYITNQTILEFGYSAMPSCLGLVSHESLEASGIQRLRNIPNFDFRGQGVLIGIIDSGIDYRNPIFINEDGTTRIAVIWDQTIVSENPPEGFFYGTEYTREQINQALQSENPLDIVPSIDDNGHGTMVAGIAGGNEVPESDFYGVAPDAEFVIIKLKPAKRYLKNFFFIPEDVLCYQENDVSFALEYLLDIHTRLGKPMAICIAVDTSQSSHDGRGTLSNFLSLMARTEGIAVNISAGNEGNARRHYYGTANISTGFDTVELNVGENEKGFSMELWGRRPSIYSVDILSPSGEFIPRIGAGVDDYREITFVFENTIIHLDYQMVESQSGDQLILFRFDNPAPGIWRFNVFERGDFNLGFDIWLPMDSFISDNTYFIKPDPYTTILTLATTLIPITVTAYNTSDDSLYINASRGYTRVAEIKPDIAAPGVNIMGPTLDGSFAVFTGTSISAAHTTGVAAMLLEWGVIRGNLPSMSSIEMKKLMIRGARRDVNLEYPNRDWGYGILDIFNIFDSLRTGLVI
jgi:subtilisin family serine protease